MDGQTDGWMNGVGCRVVGKEIVSPGCARKHSVSVIAAARQGPAEGLKSSGGQKQADTRTTSDGDQFSSFLFWRDPLLTFSDELLGLLVS